MDKQLLQEILDFLHAATDEQLSAKQSELERLIKVSQSDLRKDLKFVLRLLNQEIISRSEVWKLLNR